jgi:hypothetical protein
MIKLPRARDFVYIMDRYDWRRIGRPRVLMIRSCQVLMSPEPYPGSHLGDKVPFSGDGA